MMENVQEIDAFHGNDSKKFTKMGTLFLAYQSYTIAGDEQ